MYKPGTTNRAADAFSRRATPDSVCSSLSVVKPQWIQQVMDGYNEDSFAIELLSKLAVDPSAVPNYSLKHSLIQYRQRIWIGANPILQQKLLQACHASALGATRVSQQHMLV